MTAKTNSISEAMLRYRAENDITQNELAKRVGVSEKTIHRAECGAGLHGRTLMKIKMVIEEGTK